MRQQSTTLDPAERRRLFAEVQRTMEVEAPLICVASPKVMIAMSARVHGATPSVLAARSVERRRDFRDIAPPRRDADACRSGRIRRAAACSAPS